MMERKFTDDEIVKALECCSKKTVVDDFCDVCPNLAMGSKCMDNMLCDALDLINRQKAEIERLNSCVKTEEEVRTIAESVIKGQIAFIKSEAVKEIAKRLKLKLGFGRYTSYEELDNLVKEMTGEDNGN